MIPIAAGILVILAGIALGAFRANLAELDGAGRVRKALLVITVAMGASLALGIVPLPREAPSSPLTWRNDVEAALREAQHLGRPALLDAGAEWCKACKELEQRTFTNPDVVRALEGWITIRIDMTTFDEAQKRLERLGLNVGSLPWVGFFLPDGRLNPGVTLVDFEQPSAFLRRIDDAGKWREHPIGPVASWLTERGLLLALLLVFAAGVGVSLTPCVYPMIPITITALAGFRRGSSDAGYPFSKRVVRSGTFVLGMAITYAILGVLAALMGKGFGSWLQHQAVTLGMAALFMALAAAYLGFFSLDLPDALKSRMSRSTGGLIGLAFLGGTTSLLAAPCAGPVVVGILAVVSASRDVGLGLALMLAFALGLGLLFFILGLSIAAFSRLPRGGGWMERIEIGFAVVLVVVAIHYGKLGLGL
jgi:thiol:disulfide interchange protein